MSRRVKIRYFCRKLLKYALWAKKKWLLVRWEPTLSGRSRCRQIVRNNSSMCKKCPERQYSGLAQTLTVYTSQSQINHKWNIQNSLCRFLLGYLCNYYENWIILHACPALSNHTRDRQSSARKPTRSTTVLQAWGYRVYFKPLALIVTILCGRCNSKNCTMVTRLN